MQENKKRAEGKDVRLQEAELVKKLRAEKRKRQAEDAAKKAEDIRQRFIGRNPEPEQHRRGQTLPFTLSALLIPVKKISRGIIFTTDGRCLKIVEVLPVNFLMRSNKEQRFIIQGFLQWMKISPCRFQIRTVARKARMGEYLEKIEQEICQEENVLCRKLQEDYKQLLQEVGLKEAISRRFFLILEYDGDRQDAGEQGEAEICAALENMAQTAQKYLGNCGNEVVCPAEPTQFTMEFLYQLLNRESCRDIPFPERVRQVVEWHLAQGEENPGEKILAAEYFAPGTLDLTHAGYFVMDGIYYGCLVVPGIKYRLQNPAGWTSFLVNAGEGIDIDFFFFRQDKQRSMERIGRQIRINRSKLQDVSDTQSGFDDLADSIRSGLYLRRGLSGTEDLYYLSILITVTAYSEKGLIWRIRELRKMLAARDMDAAPCYFKQEQVFLSTLPLLSLDRDLYEKARRNLLTYGAAGCYPFSAFEMSDADGIFLGVNRTNRSLVLIDQFCSRKYSNANMVIWGTSGAGKTFLLQLIALRLRRKGIPVYLIVPDKGHEFVRACKNIDGTYIQISASSDQRINVMEIWNTQGETERVLDGQGGGSALAAKIQDLHLFFSLLIPDMSYEEKQLLDEAMVAAYREKGIGRDNRSLYRDGTGGYKEMPVLGDLHQILLGKKETSRIANILSRLVEGSGAGFNGQTNVDLDNRYVVLDVSQLSGDLRVPGMFLAVLFVWARAREDRTQKKAVVLDELWRLIGAAGNPMVAEYILEIFKVIRGYGGAAVAASQDTNDYLSMEGGRYGRGILNNSKFKVMMNMEHEDALKVQEILHLSDAETAAVTHYERGNGILSVNGTNVSVDFKASRLETELITTDRQELEALKQRLVEEGRTGEHMLE